MRIACQQSSTDNCNRSNMTSQCELLTIIAVISLAGVTNALPPQKIVGGDKCIVGEFPHQVSLKIDGKHMCGGTIISDRHILTAAHCVLGVSTKPYNNLVVSTGSIQRQAGQSHTVKAVLCHGRYVRNSQGSPNDIAVIVLTKPMQFNSVQNKIALPTTAPRDGALAKVIGWGYTVSGSLVAANELMKLDVTTAGPSLCQMMFRGGVKIHEQQICSTGGYGRGFCQGDSGGPLILDNKVIGIVSFNVPCGKGYPDVYTCVYSFVDWIKDVMKTYK